MPVNRLDALVFGSGAVAVVALSAFGFHVFFRYQYVRAGAVLSRVDRLSGRTCVMPCLPTPEPAAPKPTQSPPSLEHQVQRAIAQVQSNPTARQVVASTGGAGYEWSAVPAAGAITNGAHFADEADAFVVCYCDRDGFGPRWEAHLQSSETYYANDNKILRERYGARVRPRATAPPAAVPAVDGPRLVAEYYDLWNHGDLRTMYDMLSASYRAQHPYPVWEQQHASVVRITAQTSATGDPLTVAVVIESTDRAGAGTVDSEYRGTWALVREPSGIKLDRPDLNQTR
jgi:hypothetical protein